MNLVLIYRLHKRKVLTRFSRNFLGCFNSFQLLVDMQHDQNDDSSTDNEHGNDNHITCKHSCDMLQLTPSPCIPCHTLTHHLVFSWGNHSHTASTTIKTVSSTTGIVDCSMDIQRAAGICMPGNTTCNAGVMACKSGTLEKQESINISSLTPCDT